MKNNYLKDAKLVLVMALMVGASLAAVYATLNGRIRANAEAEALSRIPQLIPQADRAETSRTKAEVITVRTNGSTKTYKVYRAKDAAGRLVGWVVKTSGQGFGGTVELLLALDPRAERIIGLDVLAQTETPTVGDRIKEPEFRRRFEGKATDAPLVVTKATPHDPHEVQGIAGATISSRSVAEIVNTTVSDLRARLAEQAEKD